MIPYETHTIDRLQCSQRHRENDSLCHIPINKMKLKFIQKMFFTSIDMIRWRTKPRMFV